MYEKKCEVFGQEIRVGTITSDRINIGDMVTDEIKNGELTSNIIGDFTGKPNLCDMKERHPDSYRVLEAVCSSDLKTKIEDTKDVTMIDKFRYNDMWQDVKDATMNTIGMNTGKYPDTVWKKQLLLSEHSPIRIIKFNWRWTNLKSWVSVHFTRHKIGIDHFVATQRTDRTGINRDDQPQGALVKHVVESNAQSMITVSRKRLCKCASPETQAAWKLVKNEVAKVEPELASCMVPECVYRGFCPEMFPCGFSESPRYREDLKNYRDIFNTIV